MPTTTRKSTTSADPASAAEVVGDRADHADDAAVGGDTPAPVVASEVDAGDPPQIPAAELNDPDPRNAALAALLQQSPGVLSDAGPRPARRVLPRLTGGRYSWHPDGDWYLVCTSVYPRIVDDERKQLRAGDLVQVRDDDRTQSDLAYGYLVPADTAV